MRGSAVGVSELKRVGYSATDLRNAGYSNRAIAAMNKRLNGVDQANVPHYSMRLAQTAPANLPGQSTPRVRHFADDQVLTGNQNRGLMKRKVQEMVSQSAAIKAFGGKKKEPQRPGTAPEQLGGGGAVPFGGGGAVDALRANLGITKNVTAVGVGGK